MPPPQTSTLRRMAGSYKAEGVVLRSLRLGEADRVLHVYTRERGHVGVVAKGVRRTRSRFGARLEPFSQVSLVLHEGRGELHTVSAADTIETHHGGREDPYRLAGGLVAPGAAGRLFAAGAPAPRPHPALAPSLEALAARETPRRAIPAREPLLLSLQLKLHWVAGFAPELAACTACGGDDAPLVRFSAAAGGLVCERCSGGFALGPEAVCGLRDLVALPIADAPALSPRAADEIARAVADLNAEHGGFRLRTLRV